MANASKRNKASKKSTSPSHRKRTALHATMFAAVIVVLTLVLLVVELRPVKSVQTWGGAEESLALATVTAKVFATANQKQSDLTRITFSRSEVNALLTMILRIYANEKKPTDPPIYASWGNGYSNTECSIKFAGIYLNFYLKITPSYQNGKLYLQITDSKLGKLPLPDKMVEKALNEELNKQITKDRRLRKALSLLHTLRVEKSGEVQIEFLRKNSGKLIRSFF